MTAKTKTTPSAPSMIALMIGSMTPGGGGAVPPMMRMDPVMEVGWTRHRYVQLPLRSATKLQTTTDTVPLLKSGELGSPSFGVRLLSKSMNQLCMEESFAINVSVTFVPANTTIGGPGSEIVALDFPHPRAAFAYRVRFKGCGSGRMEIVPVIELGWYRHRYVQLPGRSATNDHTTTFIAAVLKSGELGSSPFGPRLLS